LSKDVLLAVRHQVALEGRCRMRQPASGQVRADPVPFARVVGGRQEG
jgi:hypothetical protein